MGVFVACVFLVCSFYVQTRGRVRHKRLVRRITDHSNYLSPVNCLFYWFSGVDNSPYIDSAAFPVLKTLEQNWEVIRDEAQRLNQARAIAASDDHDDLGFNSFFRRGWKRFYLAWYGTYPKSALASCPRTVALLKSIPIVRGAMFASLPPGAQLIRHRDPYAGSLRYHLGLVTPNSDDCFIDVDGQRYAWRDGEAVIFDETFIHYAENRTDQNRIILFLDIKRPVTFFLADWVDWLMVRLLMAPSVAKNVDGDRVGALNRLFPYLRAFRNSGKRLKAYNRRVYYALEAAIFLGIAAWFILV